MDIESTPFIRDDYYAGYDEIQGINKRLDKLENLINTDNSNLTNNIQGLSDELNTYKDSQSTNITTTDILVNNGITTDGISAVNASVDNIILGNVRIEKSLTVNSEVPIYDLKLNDAHVENIAAVGGNIWGANVYDSVLDNAEISNANISSRMVETNELVVHNTINNITVHDSTISNAFINGSTFVNSYLTNAYIHDGKGAFLNLNVDNGNINNALIENASIDKLVLNMSAEPVVSSKILGYDSNGNVIPVEAVFNIGFPVNAAYIMTNSEGLPVAGTPATEVTPDDSLITANAVWNCCLATNERLNNDFGNVWNEFNLVDDAFNTVYNAIDIVNNVIQNEFSDAYNYMGNEHAYFNNRLNGIDNNVNAVNADVLNRLLHTNSIPVSPNNGDLMLYTGATNQDYTQGGIYIYDSPNTKWNLISASQIEVGTGLHYTQNGFTNILEADTNIFCGNMNQWNNLSADQKNEYTGAAIEEDTLSGAFDIYSLTETRTDKVWIDGKPIYRKVFNVGNLPNKTTTYAQLGFSYDNVIFLGGTAKGPGNYIIPLPHVTGNNVAGSDVGLFLDGTELAVRCFGADRSTYTGWVTVEYTKQGD